MPDSACQIGHLVRARRYRCRDGQRNGESAPSRFRRCCRSRFSSAGFCFLLIIITLYLINSETSPPWRCGENQRTSKRGFRGSMNAAMPSCRLRVAEQVRHRLRQAPGRVLRHCLAIDSRDGATGVGNRRASGPSTRPTSTIPSRPIRRPEFMPPPGRSSRSRHGREAVQPDRG